MKKQLVLIGSLVLGTISGISQDRFQISSDLFTTEIGDSVFLITHYFPRYGSNSLFVLLPGDRGMLIDTPQETTGTRSLVTWIQSTFGNLQITAINSKNL